MGANYIHKVGFEIEGGWDGEKGISPFSDVSIVPEHSINGQTTNNAPKIVATHIGEVVSKPMEFEKAPWAEWLYDHWPNAKPRHRTNRTCGFHIHISTLSHRDYTLLTSKLFLYSLHARLTEIGKLCKLKEEHVFWERMNGFNSFCNLTFDPASQMKIVRKGGKNRYGWLNFSWAMHGTIEFRALPTFRDAQVALRFTSEYFDFVNQWLEQNQGQNLKRVAKLYS